MWYLQIDTLLIMLGLSLGFGLVLRFSGSHRKTILRLLPLLDIGLLLYVSEKLTAFYLGYVLVTYGFLLFLRRRKRARMFWFLLLCAACLIPLCYSRFAARLDLPMMGLTMIGIAYNMLKAIDALYYEFFSGEKITLELYGNYMLFFPVITAGPVHRFRDFRKTWENPKPLTFAAASVSTQRLIRGLFRKVVLVSLMNSLLQKVLAMEPVWYTSLSLPVIGLILLYWDMTGYADMAIAMGGYLGLTVPENFKKPFQSASFTMLWRNWNVTVSDWIRDHVFVLLNGKKLSRLQGALIAFCVMMLMALWHGFGKMNLLDGLIMGSLLALETVLGLTTVNKRKTKRSVIILRCVFVLYVLGFVALLYLVTPAQLRGIVRGYFIW